MTQHQDVVQGATDSRNCCVGLRVHCAVNQEVHSAAMLPLCNLYVYTYVYVTGNGVQYSECVDA